MAHTQGRLNLFVFLGEICVGLAAVAIDTDATVVAVVTVVVVVCRSFSRVYWRGQRNI